MDKRSGEKTSDLSSGNIDSSGVQHLKKLAKKRQKQQGCKYAEALELVAKEHGFSSWNNVHRFASKRPGPLSVEGFWRKFMFLEIRPDKDVYEYSQNGLRKIKLNSRVNLALALNIEFDHQYISADSSGFGWYTYDEPQNEGRTGFEFEEIHNQKCRMIRFWFGVDDDFQKPESIFTNEVVYIFTDEGDFHRVKRGVDDFTVGLSKK